MAWLDIIAIRAAQILAVMLLALLLLAAAWCVREGARAYFDPDIIPYDITSEGQEDQEDEFKR